MTYDKAMEHIKKHGGWIKRKHWDGAKVTWAVNQGKAFKEYEDGERIGFIPNEFDLKATDWEFV